MFGYSVKDAVITVPEFATAHERRALLDAADVAGLTVLSLMDENTAAALQHSISQTYEEDTHVLFYNMGANSIQVTIVTFGPKKVKDRNVGKLTVRGKGWDATVGGWWFDLKLTDVFAEGFNAKVGTRNEAGGMVCMRLDWKYVDMWHTVLLVLLLLPVQEYILISWIMPFR